MPAELQKLPDGKYPVPAKSHPHRIFVYGTLKMGQGNHQVMGPDKIFAGTAQLADYIMLNLGAFPAIVNAPNERKGWKVLGEVYDVTDAGLDRLDTLEGYRPENVGKGRNLYDRREVDLPFHGKAFTYIQPSAELFIGRAFIPSGDWIGSVLVRTYRWADTDNIPGQVLVPVENVRSFPARAYVGPPRSENIPVVTTPLWPRPPAPKEEANRVPLIVGPGYEES